MSQPSRLPKKYLATLKDAVEVLKLIAVKSRNNINRIKDNQKEFDTRAAVGLLSDIEAEAYRIALDLSELEVAGSCEQCPSAPVVTEADVRLELLTDQLRQLADFAHTQNDTTFTVAENS